MKIKKRSKYPKGVNLAEKLVVLFQPGTEVEIPCCYTSTAGIRPGELILRVASSNGVGRTEIQEGVPE